MRMSATKTSTRTTINCLRWQSRRGLLELDLILQKFWQRNALLSEEELHALSELLALDDEGLWRAIRGGDDGLAPAAQKVLNILREL